MGKFVIISLWWLILLSYHGLATNTLQVKETSKFWLAHTKSFEGLVGISLQFTVVVTHFNSLSIFLYLSFLVENLTHLFPVGQPLPLKQPSSVKNWQDNTRLALSVRPWKTLCIPIVGVQISPPLVLASILLHCLSFLFHLGSGADGQACLPR